MALQEQNSQCFTLLCSPLMQGNGGLASSWVHIAPGAKPVCLSHNTVKCCSLDTMLSKTVNYPNTYSQNLLFITQDLVNSFVAEYFYLDCTLPLSYTKIYVYLIINITYRIVISSKTYKPYITILSGFCVIYFRSTELFVKCCWKSISVGKWLHWFHILALYGNTIQVWDLNTERKEKSSHNAIMKSVIVFTCQFLVWNDT